MLLVERRWPILASTLFFYYLTRVLKNQKNPTKLEKRKFNDFVNIQGLQIIISTKPSCQTLDSHKQDFFKGFRKQF